MISRASVARHTRAISPLLVLAGGAAVLAGCGNSSSKPAGSAPAAQPAPVSSAPPASSPTTAAAPATGSGQTGNTVTATETEFHIALSTATFQPGVYTFRATNAGKYPHALTIDGPGVQDRATATLKPGGSGTVTVALKAGSYTVYCPVDGHRDMGMLLHIAVTGGTGSATTGPTPTAGTRHY